MTATAHLDTVDRSVEKTNVWITEVAAAVPAAVRVLVRHVSAGEIDDVLRTLPAELRSLSG